MPEPHHKITWDASLTAYRCHACGPLERAEPEEDVRAPGSRHCAEKGQCPSCWGVGVFVFERPGLTSRTCHVCGGSGRTS